MSQKVPGRREIKSKEVEKLNKKKSKKIAGKNASQYPIGPGQLLTTILEAV